MEYKNILTAIIVIGILTAATTVTNRFDPGYVPPTDQMQEVDIDNNMVCWQAGYQEAECVRFDNVWHEEIMPFTVNGVNQDFKTMYITVDNYFTNGSDGACESFGWLMNNILTDLPEGWQVYVMNSWVPSAKNPIDLGWSRVLAEGY